MKRAGGDFAGMSRRLAPKRLPVHAMVAWNVDWQAPEKEKTGMGCYVACCHSLKLLRRTNRSSTKITKKVTQEEAPVGRGLGKLHGVVDDSRCSLRCNLAFMPGAKGMPVSLATMARARALSNLVLPTRPSGCTNQNIE
ncbi:hypothetical protein CEXT_228101 [Caerostris extrusa]|uniref:Uncharacterized protein n=1 Tax=Caerostris extrusa TaxID=172846 RepID=A0AAV4TL74_CAEEX|nr:hypothetical protein CEXT_228101 [Caerostris extrusa]